MTYIPDNVLDEIEAALEFAAEFCEAEYDTRTAALGNDMSEYVSEPFDRARTLRHALAKLRDARKAEPPAAGYDLDDSIFTPEFFDAESVRGLQRQNDDLCDLFNRLIEALGEPPDDVMPETVNDWIVGQVRGLKDAAPAMSAEPMREAAAKVADKCAEQNKAAAIKLRKRQHSETDTWNSNELDDTAAEAKAIAVMIRALPLTVPKEG